MKTKFKALGNIIFYLVASFLVLIPGEYLWFKVLASNKAIGGWVSANTTMGASLDYFLQIVVFYFLFKIVNKKNLFVECKFEKIGVNSIIFTALAGIFSGFFTGCFIYIPYIEKNIPAFGNIFVALFDQGSVISLLCFLVVGMVYKEILYRGIIFNQLKRLSPLVIAIILQSVIYGATAFYSSMPLFIFGAMGSVVFVLLYIGLKSIWAPIIAQFTNLGSMFAARKMGSLISAGHAYAYILIVSGLALIAMMVYLWKNNKEVNVNVKEQTASI